MRCRAGPERGEQHCAAQEQVRAGTDKQQHKYSVLLYCATGTCVVMRSTRVVGRFVPEVVGAVLEPRLNEYVGRCVVWSTK